VAWHRLPFPISAQFAAVERKTGTQRANSGKTDHDMTWAATWVGRPFSKNWLFPFSFSVFFLFLEFSNRGEILEHGFNNFYFNRYLQYEKNRNHLKVDLESLQRSEI
jgi:hypothetical protein